MSIDNNHDRAVRAKDALLAYAAGDPSARKTVESLDPAVHEDDGWSHQLEILGDLLGDLRHWAVSVGVDYDKAMETGRGCFAEEVAEQRHLLENIAPPAPTVKHVLYGGNGHYRLGAYDTFREAMEADRVFRRECDLRGVVVPHSRIVEERE